MFNVFLRDEGRTVVYCIIVLLLVIVDITTNCVTIITTIAMYKCQTSVTVCEWDHNGVCKCVMCWLGVAALGVELFVKWVEEGAESESCSSSSFFRY